MNIKKLHFELKDPEKINSMYSVSTSGKIVYSMNFIFVANIISSKLMKGINSIEKPENRCNAVAIIISCNHSINVMNYDKVILYALHRNDLILNRNIKYKSIEFKKYANIDDSIYVDIEIFRKEDA